MKLLAVLGLGLATIAADREAAAMALGPACQQPAVEKAVLKAAQKIKYPADARTLKPDFARFEKEDNSGALICFYRLSVGNVYDFGIFKVMFKLGNRAELIVRSIMPVEGTP